MRLQTKFFYRGLEHKRMRLVGSDGFGDEDKGNGQAEVPGGEVFTVSIGDDGAAHAVERVQHVEHFWVECHLRRHLKEQLNIGDGISADVKVSQHAWQDVSLHVPQRAEWRQLRRLQVEVHPDVPDVVNAHG